MCARARALARVCVWMNVPYFNADMRTPLCAGCSHLFTDTSAWRLAGAQARIKMYSLLGGAHIFVAYVGAPKLGILID